MHDHDQVRFRDFAAMPGDGSRLFGLFGDFGVHQDRIEAFGVEIVIDDLVPGGTGLFLAASAMAWQKPPGRW